MSKKILQKKNGSALLWAVLMMIIMSAFALGVANLIRYNNGQMAYNSDLMQARHIAEAGIELGYNTLTAHPPNRSDMVINTLDLSKLPREEEIELSFKDSGKPLGVVTATLDYEVDADGITWLVISSKGVLQQSSVAVTRILKVNKDNVEDIQRYEEIE